ncbi:MAG: type II methionyl aminopeptidase, partial [Nitrosarchaeum sp.]|nr:type II methionyl aminopeptidase [Nitrosarchaeum sp.]
MGQARRACQGHPRPGGRARARPRGELAFPAQSSINACAAHYCPDETDETAYGEDDLVKIDIGAHVEGYVADNAVTVATGKHWKEHITASQDALKAAIKAAVPGASPRDIGAEIEAAIQSHGLEPIRNLSGHGIGHYAIHCEPSIPNYPSPADQTPLTEGQTIAIEPFATNGAGLIHSKGTATIFMLRGTVTPRSQHARDILKTITAYQGLPFTTRWLTRIHGRAKA